MTTSLADLLTRSAARFGDRPALVGDAFSLTYRELGDCAAATAHRLAALGVPAGSRVGLSVTRGPLPLVCSAALLLHGCAYVPLPVGVRPDRLRHMLDRADINWAVCDAAGRDSLAAAGVRIATVDSGDLQPPRNPPQISGAGPAADDAAYVIFTSGSTGLPKGVEITHRNVLALLDDAVPLFGFGPDEVWPLQHGYEFDVSVWEMWAGLAVGATLIAIGPDTVKDPALLAHALRRHRATRLHVVPSIFRHLCEAAAEDDIQIPLRNVTFAGEAIQYAPIRQWASAQQGPPPEWFNVYGITETTVYNTMHRVTEKDLASAEPATPIGTAYPRSPMIVVDERLAEVPPGETGELLVGGLQVAKGYVGDDAQTAARFTVVPGRPGVWYRTGDFGFREQDGGLRYVGRVDGQVKIRGTRVELAEVEHALCALPWVLDAAACVYRSGLAEPLLGAALVVARTASAPPGTRQALRMIRDGFTGQPQLAPNRVALVEGLPLNGNGKIDRNAVADLVYPPQ